MRSIVSIAVLVLLAAPGSPLVAGQPNGPGPGKIIATHGATRLTSAKVLPCDAADETVDCLVFKTDDLSEGKQITTSAILTQRFTDAQLELFEQPKAPSAVVSCSAVQVAEVVAPTGKTITLAQATGCKLLELKPAP